MKFKILIVLIISINFCSAQTRNYNYVGTLLMKNRPPISFALELYEQDGNVSGYSITNKNTVDETKSEIKGIYFKKSKTFQIQEIQIITTKSEAPINSFCYIRMNLRNIKVIYRYFFIKGSNISNWVLDYIFIFIYSVNYITNI